MNPRAKKSSAAQNIKRPVAPPAYRPQTPNAVQPKMATGAVNRKPQVAPPVYRPQPAPRVLQTKSSSGQSSPAGQAPRQPVAPPVYRPEAKRIVQPKAISQQRLSPTAPPVYRPQQQRVAQPKMASAVPAHTPPKAPPVYRPQVKGTAHNVPAQTKMKSSGAPNMLKGVNAPHVPHLSCCRAARVVQRVVTDKRGKIIKDTEARKALIRQFNVPPTDLESLAVIEAVINDTKHHSYEEVMMMMPPPRYTPSGRLETSLGTMNDFGHHPLGFESHDEFQLFIHKIYSNLPVKDAKVVFHGSSLSGQSFKDKGGGSKLFDVGRDSDYDVAIVSPHLWQMAIEFGVKIRGDHSEPLTPESIELLGLGKAFAAANFLARREVNFMLYQSEASAHQHEGAALDAPQAEDYREIVGILHT